MMNELLMCWPWRGKHLTGRIISICCGTHVDCVWTVWMWNVCMWKCKAVKCLWWRVCGQSDRLLAHVDRMWIVVNSKCELIFARAFPPFRCCCCCCCYLHWHLVWLYVCVCWRAATCGRLPATLWTPLWNVGITGKLRTASHAIRLMSVCVCVSIEKSNSCLWFVKTFLN